MIDEHDDWKVVLANLKRLSKAIGTYYQRHLRSKYDPNFSDLLLIAQNKDSS
jgi:hypothetical protein